MPLKKDEEVFVILSEEDRKSLDAREQKDVRKELPQRTASASETGASQNSHDGAAKVTPSAGAIAKRAFELYLARGGSHGRDLEDWLEAERELRSRA